MNPQIPTRKETLLTQRKRLTNMRIIVPAVSAYMLYNGIDTIRRSESTPAYFYVFLVVFFGFMIFAFFLNQKRIRDIDIRIAEEEAREAQEAGETDESEEKSDWPDDLSQS
jgi:hypothetical protein